jgi:predicted GNAT family acetyltransferase
VDIEVLDNAEEHRYEARSGSELVGRISYDLEGDQITLIHTEVEPEHEGKGIAGRLVGGALADIRGRGLRVRPMCRFVRSYLERHPEHADLIAES